MADQKATLDLLARVPMFQGLSRKELEQVSRASGEVRHAQGKEVTREGAEGIGFHLILEGEAVVEQGGRTLRTMGPGDSFGDIALIDGGKRTATVRATTPLRTLSIAAWDFKPVLVGNAEIAYKLLLQLCARLREAEARGAAPVD